MPVYEVVGRRSLWQSKWYGLREDRLRDAEGQEFTYTVVDHPGSVVVVPVTSEGRIVLIRHYRHPVGEYCIEVPAGGLEPGSAPEQAAKRELLEEVGGRAEQLIHLCCYYPSNGISNERAHVFLATGVQLGEPRREPTEKMEIDLVTPTEALRMVRSGEISDGRAALALLWCGPLLL